MKIRVVTPKFIHERRFVLEFAETAKDLGHELVDNTGCDLILQWGYTPNDIPTLYAECGWLPRWAYQLSHTGINGKHDRVPLRLERLDEDDRWKARTHLRRIREGLDAPREWGYVDISAAPVTKVPRQFILAPLQMEDDVNMDSAPVGLRTAQDFIGFAAEHRDLYMPGVPIIYKQHPNTRAGYQLKLTAYGSDRIVPHSDGHVYAYLKHGGCRAVVTVNSNVAIDALLWDVPVVTFGRGIWSGNAVFLPSLSQIGHWHVGRERRLEFVRALMLTQWDLRKARSPLLVDAAIQGAMEE